MRDNILHIVRTATNEQQLSIGLASYIKRLNELDPEQRSFLSVAAEAGNLISLTWLFRNGATLRNGIGDVLYWASSNKQTAPRTLAHLKTLLKETEKPDISSADIEAALGNVEFFSGANRAALSQANSLGITPAFYAYINGQNAVVELLEPSEYPIIIQNHLQHPNAWRSHAHYLSRLASVIESRDPNKAIQYWQAAESIFKDLTATRKSDWDDLDECELAKCWVGLLGQAESSADKEKYFNSTLSHYLRTPNRPDYHSIGLLIESLFQQEPQNVDSRLAIRVVDSMIKWNIFYEGLSSNAMRFIAEEFKQLSVVTRKYISSWRSADEALKKQFMAHEKCELTYRGAIKEQNPIDCQRIASILLGENTQRRDFKEVVKELPEYIANANMRDGTLRWLGSKGYGDEKKYAFKAIEVKTDEDYRELLSFQNLYLSEETEYLELISRKTHLEFRRLGEIYADAGEHQKALDAYLCAFRLSSSGSTEELYFSYLAAASLYFELEEYEKSLKFCGESWLLWERSKIDLSKPQIGPDLNQRKRVHVLDAMEIYIRAGDFKMARSISQRIFMGDCSHQGRWEFLLGQLALAAGNPKMAAVHFKAAHAKILEWFISPKDTGTPQKERLVNLCFEVGKCLPLDRKTWEPLLDLMLYNSRILDRVAKYFLEQYYEGSQTLKKEILGIYNSTAHALKSTKRLDTQHADQECFAAFRTQKVCREHAETNLYANVRLLDYAKSDAGKAELGKRILSLATAPVLQHYFKLAMVGDDIGRCVFKYFSELCGATLHESVKAVPKSPAKPSKAPPEERLSFEKSPPAYAESLGEKSSEKIPENSEGKSQETPKENANEKNRAEIFMYLGLYLAHNPISNNSSDNSNNLPAISPLVSKMIEEVAQNCGPEWILSGEYSDIILDKILRTILEKAGEVFLSKLFVYDEARKFPKNFVALCKKAQALVAEPGKFTALKNASAYLGKIAEYIIDAEKPKSPAQLNSQKTPAPIAPPASAEKTEEAPLPIAPPSEKSEEAAISLAQLRSAAKTEEGPASIVPVASVEKIDEERSVAHSFAPEKLAEISLLTEEPTFAEKPQESNFLSEPLSDLPNGIEKKNLSDESLASKNNSNPDEKLKLENDELRAEIATLKAELSVHDELRAKIARLEAELAAHKKSDFEVRLRLFKEIKSNPVQSEKRNPQNAERRSRSYSLE